MPRAVLLSALLLAASALAQGPREGGSDASPQDEGPASGALEDARMNGATMVESFVASKSPKGYWPFREKATGAIYKLRLLRVDEKGVRPLPGGRHAVPAVFEDASAKTRLTMEFVVNMTGAEWKVEAMRLLKKASPPPAKGRKSAPGKSRN